MDSSGNYKTVETMRDQTKARVAALEEYGAKVEENREKSKRGFASMSPEKRAAIASQGGKAAQRQGTAHRWNKESARSAGQKGGKKVSSNTEHMKLIGAIGGLARARKARGDGLPKL